MELNELNYPLLSDANYEISKAFGVLDEGFAGVFKASKRSLFLVKDGKIAYKWVVDEPGNYPLFDDLKSVLSRQENFISIVRNNYLMGEEYLYRPFKKFKIPKEFVDLLSKSNTREFFLSDDGEVMIILMKGEEVHAYLGRESGIYVHFNKNPYINYESVFIQLLGFTVEDIDEVTKNLFFSFCEDIVQYNAIKSGEGMLNFSVQILVYLYEMSKKQIIKMLKSEIYDSTKVSELLENPNLFRPFFNRESKLFNILNVENPETELLRAATAHLIRNGLVIDFDLAIDLSSLAFLYKAYGDDIPREYYKIVDTINRSCGENTVLGNEFILKIIGFSQYFKQHKEWREHRTLETMSSIEKEIYYNSILERDRQDFTENFKEMKKFIDTFRSLYKPEWGEKIEEDDVKRVKKVIKLVKETEEIIFRTMFEEPLPLPEINLRIDIPRALKSRINNKLKVFYKFENRYDEDWIFGGDETGFFLSGVDVEWKIEEKRVDDWFSYYSKTISHTDSQWILNKTEKRKRRLSIVKLASIATGTDEEHFFDMKPEDSAQAEKFCILFRLLFTSIDLVPLKIEKLMGFDRFLDEIFFNHSSIDYLSRNYGTHPIDTFFNKFGLDLTGVLHCILDRFGDNLLMVAQQEEPAEIDFLETLHTTSFFGVKDISKEINKSREMCLQLNKNSLLSLWIDFIVTLKAAQIKGIHLERLRSFEEYLINEKGIDYRKLDLSDLEKYKII